MKPPPDAVAASPSRSAPLAAQILALLFGTFALIQIAGVAAIFALPQPRPPIVHLSEAVRALDADPGPLSDGFVLATLSAAELPLDKDRETRLEAPLARQLGVARSSVRVWVGRRNGPMEFVDATQIDPVAMTPLEIGLRLSDGRWKVATKTGEGLFDVSWRLLTWVGLTLLIIAPISFSLARRLLRPVALFAEAAERLGQQPDAPSLSLSGPREVQSAVRAFNTMQRRLQAYVNDRIRLVAAIAHDLRTPLTRLKIQLADLPYATRTRAEREILAMEQLIDTILVFVKDSQVLSQRGRLHLGSLVESVAADLAEVGLQVTVSIVAEPIVYGDAVGLRRLVTNLIDNAQKYGHRARCQVDESEGWAIIRVEDDGPGVPEGDLERLFEPFERGEASRNAQMGGAGLGLSIVRSITAAHGGQVRLINGAEGGLIAEVRLPVDENAGL